MSVCPNNEDGSRLYVVPTAEERLADPKVALEGTSLGSGGNKWRSGVQSKQGIIYGIP
jgi:hypothetical protein